MKTPLLALSVLVVSTVFAKPFNMFQPVEVKSSDACFSPVEKCDVKLMSFIGLAQTQMNVAIFSLTHGGIANAIQQAAAHGVKVRMVVDRDQATADNSKISDLKGVAGIEIKIGVAKSMTHDKFMIIDQKQLETGSYNYTVNATINNLENQIYRFFPLHRIRQ